MINVLLGLDKKKEVYRSIALPLTVKNGSNIRMDTYI